MERPLINYKLIVLVLTSGIVGAFKNAAALTEETPRFDQGSIDHEEDNTICSINEYLLVDKVEQERENFIVKINTILPFQLPALAPGESATEWAYEALSQFYNLPTSRKRLANFVAAVDEIRAAYVATCDGLDAVPGIPELAENFSKLTMHLNRISKEHLAQIRNIFGQFLGLAQNSVLERAKREAGGDECSCPMEITEICHFFACIDVTETKYITGFADDFVGTPCIGFIVDTTGSMHDNIDDARRVILQFMKSQRNNSWCYLLVPFNDYDPDYVDYGDYDDHVGPISHVFTGGEYTETVISQLQSFEEAVKSLRASGGGDYAEYSLRAMLYALNYSFIDGDGYSFTPMEANSEMIVLTDAASKEEELEGMVIEEANKKDVSINFIRPNTGYGFQTYSVYVNIANKTNGVDYVHDDSFTWSILQFHTKFNKKEPERRKRSIITGEGEFDVSVSRFTYFLHVSTLSTSLSSGNASITTPERTVEHINIEKNIMIYLKPNPTPGTYTFRIGAEINHFLIDEDTSLDASIFYFGSDFTVSSLQPLQECAMGKLVLATSKIQEISSLNLIESRSDGSSRLIPLTRCSNAFMCDYHFRAGTFSFQLQGVDSNGVHFTDNNFNKSIFIPSSSNARLSLRPINSTGIVIEYSAQFRMEFQLQSNDSIGTYNFSLSVSAAGFITHLNVSAVKLLPMQTRVITVTGNVGITAVPLGSTHNITVSASNECMTLTTVRTVTLKAVATVAPSVVPTDECGCQNGGTCVIASRRGRRFMRCVCASGFVGSRCQRRI